MTNETFSGKNKMNAESLQFFKGSFHCINVRIKELNILCTENFSKSQCYLKNIFNQLQNLNASSGNLPTKTEFGDGTGRVEGLKKLVSDSISLIQFQDIIDQKLNHLYKIHCSLITQISKSGEIRWDSEILITAKTIAELSHAQLTYIKGEYEGVFTNLELVFDRINEEMESILVDKSFNSKEKCKEEDQFMSVINSPLFSNSTENILTDLKKISETLSFSDSTYCVSIKESPFKEFDQIFTTSMERKIFKKIMKQTDNNYKEDPAGSIDFF